MKPWFGVKSYKNKQCAVLVALRIHFTGWLCCSSTSALVLYIQIIIIKNVSSSTSHKKTPSFRLYVHTSYENLWPNPSPNAFPKLCERFSACFALEGRGTVPSFKFFLRLCMMSWGHFYVTERFCDFLKRHNLLIKIQPCLTFLWTTFCPYFLFLPTKPLSILVLAPLLHIICTNFLHFFGAIWEKFELCLV